MKRTTAKAPGGVPGQRGQLTRLLAACLPRYTRAITLIVTLQAVQAAAALYLPTLNASLIDNGVLRGDTGYIAATGGWMLAVTAVQILCVSAVLRIAARTAMGAGRDLRAAVVRKVLAFSGREMARFGAPSLITRTTNDVQQVQLLMLTAGTLMVPAPLVCAGGIILALRLDVPLSSLLAIIVPVLAVLVVVLTSRMRPLFVAMQERIDVISRLLREQITGVRVIRAFSRDAREQERFAAANRDLMAVGLRTGQLMAALSPALLIVINVSSIAVLWLGGHRVADGMPIGDLTAFLSYLMQILVAVMMATFSFAMVPRAEICAGRIKEVLDTEVSLAAAAAPVRALPLRGQLELRDVSFSYAGASEPVLRGISLAVGRGQRLALIGSTGAGKTTLLNLVPRLTDATGGQVLVGGVDVRLIEPKLLARTVGLVPQRAHLFTGTIASNLRYGDPQAADSDLWRALEVAQAIEFVEAMPAKLDAPVGPGGAGLSGGQRQRLAVARMLLARPEILLFDDTFSALDFGTEAALRASLAAETADAAVVVVAQRVAAIRDFETIVVLDRGTVMGSGSHEELLATCPVYQEIVSSQPADAVFADTGMVA